MNAFLFFSGMNVLCDVSWFLYKRTLQYAALSMVDSTSKLAISKGSASEDVDDD